MIGRHLIPGWTYRGIWTSPADYWVHLWPKPLHEIPGIYWYKAQDMRNHLEKASREGTIRWHEGAKSKNGKISGKGYLVRKAEGFIKSTDVPEELLAKYDWWRMRDDNELGKAGEKLLPELNECIRKANPYHPALQPISLAMQLRSGAGDFRFGDKTNELKTECPHYYTPNLFVQTHEHEHQVYARRQER